MSRFALTNCKVMVDGVEFSGHAFNIDTPQEKEQIDVSGFGARAYIPGLDDDSLIVQFVQDFGTVSGENVHQKLYTLYSSGSQFPVYVQPDKTAGTSATNPLYGGTASLFTYNGLSGALNARAEVSAMFRPIEGSFTWGTVAPS